MSEKQKYPREAAEALASLLQNFLAGGCKRIRVAGSLRRGKAEVGDIEILYVAREHLAPTGLFDSELVNFAEGRIQAALDNGILVKRPNKRGHFTWGPKNKLAVHVGSGIPVDLFATTEENWWVSLVIRTGSKETNLKLAMGAQERGRSLEAYGSGVRDLATGEVTPATSERQVFELCGVEYLEPEYR